MLYSSMERLNLLAVLLCSNQKLYLEKSKTGIIVSYGEDLSKKIATEIYA